MGNNETQHCMKFQTDVSYPCAARYSNVFVNKARISELKYDEFWPVRGLLKYVCLLLPLLSVTLGGDKVSTLTHTYPHKPLRMIEMTVCNHQADSPLYVWPAVRSEDLQV